MITEMCVRVDLLKLDLYGVHVVIVNDSYRFLNKLNTFYLLCTCCMHTCMCVISLELPSLGSRPNFRFYIGSIENYFSLGILLVKKFTWS